MGNGLSFEVSWSRKSLEDARAIRDQARAAGREKELVRIPRLINHRLHTAPLEFGDVFRSQEFVHEHAAYCEFVGLNFAVDTQQRFVLVRRCRALPTLD